jgi:hypothetical protein
LEKILKDLQELQDAIKLCKDLDKERAERLCASLNEALDFIKEEALHETCNNRPDVATRVPTESG